MNFRLIIILLLQFLPLIIIGQQVIEIPSRQARLKEDTINFNLEHASIYLSGESHYFTLEPKIEFALFKYLYCYKNVKHLILEASSSEEYLVRYYIENKKHLYFGRNGTDYLKDFDKSRYRNFYELLFEFASVQKIKLSVSSIDLEHDIKIGLQVLDLILPHAYVFPDEIKRILMPFEKGEIRQNNCGEFIQSMLTGVEKNSEVFDQLIKEKSSYLKRLLLDIEAGLKYNELINSDNLKEALIFRENYMFEKLKSVIEQNKQDHFFGQLGSLHLLNGELKRNNLIGRDNRSVVSMLLQDRNILKLEDLCTIEIHNIRDPYPLYKLSYNDKLRKKELAVIKTDAGSKEYAVPASSFDYIFVIKSKVLRRKM